MIESPSHALMWRGPGRDDIDLISWNESNGERFEVATLADDATWGNPRDVREGLEAMLAEGLLSGTNTEGAREAFLRVMVAGDAVSLAEGEAVLALACRGMSELHWTPPGGFAATSVFDVVAARVEHVFDDMDELRSQRTYGLRLTLHPYARSLDEVTVDIPAPAGGDVTTTQVDPLTSLSGWSSPNTNPAVTFALVSGGGIRATREQEIPDKQFRSPSFITILKNYTRSWPADQPYLRIVWSSSNVRPDIFINQQQAVEVASAGATRWYARPEGATSLSRVAFSGRFTVAGKQARITPRAMHFTNATEVASTGRATNRTAQVSGSAPTEAALTLTTVTSFGLGAVLAYTYPDTLGDYQPPLSPYYSSGGSVQADPNAITGQWLTAGGGLVYKVPAAAWADGSRHLVLHAKATDSSGRHQVDWQITTPRGESLSGTAYPPIGTAGTVVAVDEVQASSRFADGAEGEVTVTITATNVLIDEAWLYHEDGSLTWADVGFSTACTITSPSLADPQPGVFVDGVSVPVRSLEPHRWEPGNRRTHIVTTGAAFVQAELSYSPRWHTHAGRTA